MKQSRNSELLASFTAYCEAHPDERFWQALRNWSGHSYIFVSVIPQWLVSLGGLGLSDTFHWEGKDK